MSHFNLSEVVLGGKMFMKPSRFWPMGPQSISAPSVTAAIDKICPLCGESFFELDVLVYIINTFGRNIFTCGLTDKGSDV